MRHQRSLAETVMFRFKKLLGTNISARTNNRQSREIGIKCSIINKINQLAMPQYSVR